jgi:hypothetical protein
MMVVSIVITDPSITAAPVVIRHSATEAGTPEPPPLLPLPPPTKTLPLLRLIVPSVFLSFVVFAQCST